MPWIDQSWHDPRVRRKSVLIVDDHVAYCSTAERLLQSEGFDVVGSANDAADAVRATRRLLPDVVLLDIQLPDGDGFDVARRLAALERPPIVVLMSSRTASAYGDRIERAPVRGFLTKDELSGDALATFLR